MGTIYDQPPRGLKTVNFENVENELQALIYIADNNEVDLKDVISVAHLLEKRRATSAYIENGDIHDEQMSGFAEILEDLAKNINCLK